MDDLIARIRAAIDEDERVAQQATTPGGSRGEWAYGNRRISDDLGVLVVGHIPANRGRHIVRHDPKRVLAMVAAHRAILAEHERICDQYNDPKRTEPMAAGPAYGLWLAITALAKGYGIET